MPTIFEDVLRIVRHREAARQEYDAATLAMSVAQQKQIAAAALIELLDAELAKYLPLTVADLIVKLDTKEPLPVEPPPPAK